MIGLHFGTDGCLYHGELLGPPNIDCWLACWTVLQTCLIMMDCADVACLIRYGKHIVRLAHTFGETCWPLLYQAECRYRREEMAWMLRDESDKYNDALLAQTVYPHFNTNRPYAYLWTIATSKDFSWYWTDHVKDKSFQVLIKHRQMNQFIDGDCPIAASASEHMATSGTIEYTMGSSSSSSAVPWVKPKGAPRNNGQPNPRQSDAPAASRKGRKSFGKGKQHNVVNGRYTTNRAGTPLCSGFQSGTCHGKCGCVCPLDGFSAHHCDRCLGDHGGDTPQSCNKIAPAQPPLGISTRQAAASNPKGKGKKGGKGGGKKGGKKGVKKPWWQQ